MWVRFPKTILRTHYIELKTRFINLSCSIFAPQFKQVLYRGNFLANMMKRNIRSQVNRKSAFYVYKSHRAVEQRISQYTGVCFHAHTKDGGRFTKLIYEYTHTHRNLSNILWAIKQNLFTARTGCKPALNILLLMRAMSFAIFLFVRCGIECAIGARIAAPHRDFKFQQVYTLKFKHIY